jgi:predicted ATPase
LFQRLLWFDAHETPDVKLEQLAHALSQYSLPLEESVQLFAPLLSLPIPEHRYTPLTLSPQRQRQKTLETLVTILLELAERQPVLLIIEDLHWADPTTLALLNLVLDQTPTAAMLVLLTCRPHFQPAWHHRSYITDMTLNHLSQSQVEQIVTGMTHGKTLPHEVLAQIIEKTDGVPLFVEELTKAILESGHLQVVDGHYALAGALSTLAIPATLQDSLMARLDRLVTAKAVAQYAAVIGRQFSYALLQAVSQLDEVTLSRELGRLVEAEIVYHRGVPPQVTYTFKHPLIQDAAYESLLKSTRQQYHRRIAQVLEAQFPETAETQPELLAHHCTEAGLSARAIVYWQHAGQRALERSANLEAVAHLSKGLELLKTLPDTAERIQQELDVQITLGPALMALKGQGAPEVEQVYIRARALCTQVGETPRLFPVLWGLREFYNARGELQTARELGEQGLALAERQPDSALVLEAHAALAATLFYLGEFALACSHAEQGLALYDPQQHCHLAHRGAGQDVGVLCLNHLSASLGYLGYADQAFQRRREMVTLARGLAHPLSLAAALSWTARFHQIRREPQVVHELADAVIALATAQDFPQWRAQGSVLRGWALAEQGQAAAGVTEIRQGLAAWRATGAEIGRQWRLLLLAEAQGHMGQIAAGLATLTEALAIVEATGDRRDEAELHRLTGEFLLRQTVPEAPQAEACFQQALTVARRQEAKALELRAAMSLARLWQSQGKRTAPHELLAPIYGWFTEGFDTADLQEAQALLAALRGDGPAC